jgi:hypothetical protein
MKRATMLLLLSVPFFTLHHPAIAQEPSTTASTQSALSSAPHSDEWKIKLRQTVDETQRERTAYAE